MHAAKEKETGVYCFEYAMGEYAVERAPGRLSRLCNKIIKFEVVLWVLKIISMCLSKGDRNIDYFHKFSSHKNTYTILEKKYIMTSRY